MRVRGQLRLNRAQAAGCLVFGRHFHSFKARQIALDEKWLKIWRDHPPRGSAEGTKGSFMCIPMFPYPSGILHCGHLRVYTISDTLARYRRMNGYNVIHAMGWDAFGLPAENAAIQNNVDASEWTYSNIEKMKSQMEIMFADFDWDREVITCSPDYYKHTQKLFLMLHEKGLAYRKEAEVNWDPVDMTVVANEQVDNEGKSWRSGAKVEKKLLNQWFLGITKYADALIRDLNLLEEWPQKVLSMQRNWIGESYGADIIFKGETSESDLQVFTSRPDTLFGVQFVAVSLNHSLVKALAEENLELKQFISAEHAEDSKAGFQLPGIFVSNPLRPGKFDVPVFAAPFVLSDYGLGAVMGCPAHDARDSEFWKLNGNSPPLSVIDSPEGAKTLFTEKSGTLNSNCGKYSGLSSEEGGRALVADLEKMHLAKTTKKLRLRDWLISRQRFWGAPIPIVHCDSCGTVPVPDEQLPVMLPANNTKPLAQNQEFLETTCPSCGSHAKRDSDTMDTFMDSSWYFFRYCDPQNKELLFDAEKVNTTMPVNLYIGGVEHAILHLLYSRFIGKFLVDAGAWDGGSMSGEPIKRLLSQGMVQGETFIDPQSGKFLKPEELVERGDEMVVKATGDIPRVAYEKMSKSKFNGIDPVVVTKAHGADATRAYVLFQGPVEDNINWDSKKISGTERWLNRVQSAVASSLKNGVVSRSLDTNKLSNEQKLSFNEIQSKLGSISEALHNSITLNTLISDYMKLTRTVMSIAESKDCPPEFRLYAVETLLKVIAPVVPANAEEGWESLCQARGTEWKTIFEEEWPQQLPALEVQTNLIYSVVLNGKQLMKFEHLEIEEEQLTKKVLEQSQIIEALAGKEIKKLIVPKGKNTVVIIAH